MIKQIGIILLAIFISTINGIIISNYYLSGNHFFLLALLSQCFFLIFIILMHIRQRSRVSVLIKSILNIIEKLNNQEPFDFKLTLSDTTESIVYHELYRLYEILISTQHALETEHEKLQGFISDTSHQVKTPITNLKLLQATLNNSSLTNEEYRYYFKSQEKQIEKLDFLIQNLIKASRFENKLIQVHPHLDSINETIISAIEFVLLAAEKKNINISFDNSVKFKARHDSKWTSEAIFNILDNSIKYTPKNGSIKIYVSRTENYLKITIKDTGIGISQKDIDKIFTRFWRGETGIAEGTGIGLYLSKKIILLQNGYIQVVSHLGKGSTFNIYLPL